MENKFTPEILAKMGIVKQSNGVYSRPVVKFERKMIVKNPGKKTHEVLQCEIYKEKRKYPEYELQKRICNYLNQTFPDVLFMSDTIAAVKLTIPQAGRNNAIQKKNFKCPDIIIFAALNGYHALFIELKVKSPFKKDGTIYRDDHLEGQEQTIYKLRSLGYAAYFAWSEEQAINIINEYLK